MKDIVHISAYRFVKVDKLQTLKLHMKDRCERLALHGTVLLGPEGINLMLAGSRKNIDAFKRYLDEDKRFADMVYKESLTRENPFKRLYIKIKPEIVTFRQTDIEPEKRAAKHLSPKEFKKWLDENRDIIVLDTRNDYELAYGTFEKALDPKIQNFRQFPEAVERLPKDLKEKPVVMFCTGGIRCEKAGPYMEQQGFKEVYQLDGGILNYFKECGDAHYEGECFVFDERVAVNADMEETQLECCLSCNMPVQDVHCQCGHVTC